MVSSSGRERREIWNGLIDVDGYMDWTKRGERSILWIQSENCVVAIILAALQHIRPS